MKTNEFIDSALKKVGAMKVHDTRGYGDLHEGYQLTEEGVYQLVELIVEECRNVVNDVYHKTPFHLCGPLLTADEEITIRFYGD